MPKRRAASRWLSPSTWQAWRTRPYSSTENIPAFPGSFRTSLRTAMPRYAFVPPRPDYPTASVAYFSSAALMPFLTNDPLPQCLQQSSAMGASTLGGHERDVSAISLKLSVSVLQARLDAVIVLARHDHEAVDLAVEGGQPLHDGRGLALRVLLVHPVEQRQLALERVDQRRLVAALAQLLQDEAGGADARPVAPHRAEEDREPQRHAPYLRSGGGRADGRGAGLRHAPEEHPGPRLLLRQAAEVPAEQDGAGETFAVP